MALVVRGDARALPLPDASVDLVVTSPPYFALRSYTDGGRHYAGQIGSEDTPAEWVSALLACTREWVRVLKPGGSIWVNLGDKYATGPPVGNTSVGGLTAAAPTRADHRLQRVDTTQFAPRKSLLGLPWRYALACVDELGLILRAEVIWSKPNGLPESVTDRVRRSHEQWFHFTVQPRYYAAVDEIREPHTGPQFKGRAGINSDAWQPDTQAWRSGGKGFEMVHRDYNPLGKLPGSVWSVPSEPLIVPEHLGVDHFAAFPTEWPRRIILGWSPSGICVECGEGRRPVAQVEGQSTYAMIGKTHAQNTDTTKGAHDWNTRTANGTTPHFEPRQRSITGYACACPEPTAPIRPAVVLDPFGGTGTTALVASVLGRVGVSVDLSGDYCRLARWRTTDPTQREKVAARHARAMPQTPQALAQPDACCATHDQDEDCRPPMVCCPDCPRIPALAETREEERVSA